MAFRLAHCPCCLHFHLQHFDGHLRCDAHRAHHHAHDGLRHVRGDLHREVRALCVLRCVTQKHQYRLHQHSHCVSRRLDSLGHCHGAHRVGQSAHCDRHHGGCRHFRAVLGPRCSRLVRCYARFFHCARCRLHCDRFDHLCGHRGHRDRHGVRRCAHHFARRVLCARHLCPCVRRACQRSWRVLLGQLTQRQINVSTSQRNHHCFQFLFRRALA